MEYLTRVFGKIESNLSIFLNGNNSIFGLLTSIQFGFWLGMRSLTLFNAWRCLCYQGQHNKLVMFLNQRYLLKTSKLIIDDDFDHSTSDADDDDEVWPLTFSSFFNQNINQKILLIYLHRIKRTKFLLLLFFFYCYCRCYCSEPRCCSCCCNNKSLYYSFLSIPSTTLFSFLLFLLSVCLHFAVQYHNFI